jgi:hypothetical protein
MAAAVKSAVILQFAQLLIFVNPFKGYAALDNPKAMPREKRTLIWLGVRTLLTF